MGEPDGDEEDMCVLRAAQLCQIQSLSHCLRGGWMLGVGRGGILSSVLKAFRSTRAARPLDGPYIRCLSNPHTPSCPAVKQKSQVESRKRKADQMTT